MNWMKLVIISLLLSLGSNVAIAQYTSSEDSDPRAIKMLDNLKNKYDSYTSMEIDFDLILELPGQPKEVQKGLVIQSGDKFVAKVDDQHIYCDAKTVWLHLVENNEVQLNDYDEMASGEMMSPKDMLQLYEDGEFVTIITGEENLGKTKVTLIEFKPLDRDSEYSKMKLYVDSKTGEAKKMMVFSKDGSRYALVINKLVPNKKYGDDTFTFDASKFKDIYIEDLRLD